MTQSYNPAIEYTPVSIGTSPFLSKADNVLKSTSKAAMKAALAPFYLFHITADEKKAVQNGIEQIANAYYQNHISNHQIASMVDQFTGRSYKMKRSLQRGLVDAGVVNSVKDIRYDDQEVILGVSLYRYDRDKGILSNLLNQFRDKRVLPRDVFTTSMLYSTIGATGGLSGLLGFTAKKTAITAGFHGTGKILKEYDINAFGNSDFGKKLQDDSLQIGESMAYSLDLGAARLVQTGLRHVKGLYGNKSIFGKRVSELCDAGEIASDHYVTARIGTGAFAAGWGDFISEVHAADNTTKQQTGGTNEKILKAELGSDLSTIDIGGDTIKEALQDSYLKEVEKRFEFGVDSRPDDMQLNKDGHLIYHADPKNSDIKTEQDLVKKVSATLGKYPGLKGKFTLFDLKDNNPDVANEVLADLKVKEVDLGKASRYVNTERFAKQDSILEDALYKGKFFNWWGSKDNVEISPFNVLDKDCGNPTEQYGQITVDNPGFGYREFVQRMHDAGIHPKSNGSLEGKLVHIQKLNPELSQNEFIKSDDINLGYVPDFNFKGLSVETAQPTEKTVMTRPEKALIIPQIEKVLPEKQIQPFDPYKAEIGSVFYATGVDKTPHVPFVNGDLQQGIAQITTGEDCNDLIVKLHDIKNGHLKEYFKSNLEKNLFIELRGDFDKDGHTDVKYEKVDPNGITTFENVGVFDKAPQGFNFLSKGAKFQVGAVLFEDYDKNCSTDKIYLSSVDSVKDNLNVKTGYIVKPEVAEPVTPAPALEVTPAEIEILEDKIKDLEHVAEVKALEYAAKIKDLDYAAKTKAFEDEIKDLKQAAEIKASEYAAKTEALQDKIEALEQAAKEYRPTPKIEAEKPVILAPPELPTYDDQQNIEARFNDEELSQSIYLDQTKYGLHQDITILRELKESGTLTFGIDPENVHIILEKINNPKDPMHNLFTTDVELKKQVHGVDMLEVCTNELEKGTYRVKLIRDIGYKVDDPHLEEPTVNTKGFKWNTHTDETDTDYVVFKYSPEKPVTVVPIEPTLGSLFEEINLIKHPGFIHSVKNTIYSADDVPYEIGLAGGVTSDMVAGQFSNLMGWDIYYFESHDNPDRPDLSDAKYFLITKKGQDVFSYKSNGHFDQDAETFDAGDVPFKLANENNKQAILSKWKAREEVDVSKIWKHGSKDRLDWEPQKDDHLFALFKLDGKEGGRWKHIDKVDRYIMQGPDSIEEILEQAYKDFGTNKTRLWLMWSDDNDHVVEPGEILAGVITPTETPDGKKINEPVYLLWKNIVRIGRPKDVDVGGDAAEVPAGPSPGNPPGHEGGSLR